MFDIHSARHYTPLDRALIAGQQLWETLQGTLPHSGRPYPAADLPPDPSWTAAEQRVAQGCMRVNCSGEVAAQALYRGQAWGTHDPTLQAQLHHAAVEESDHLHWCRTRLQELGTAPSIWDPAWLVIHLVMGWAVARWGGEGMNLGFLVETEEQVIRHLSDHLNQLPPSDHRSRAIVRQMQADEATHAAMAQEAGARPVPPWFRWAMTIGSRFLTTLSYYK